MGDTAQEAPDHDEITRTSPGDHEAAALEGPVAFVEEPMGDRSENDLAARPAGDHPDEYGAYKPGADQGTPHLDSAKEVVRDGERYHAGLGDLSLKHGATIVGVSALAGGLLFSSFGGGSSVSAQERNTTQIAAAAEYPGGAPTPQAAVQALSIESITPAKDPRDENGVQKEIQAAEVEGAAGMHGGTSGVTSREYAVEALATDQLSGVAVPADASEAMTAGELADQSGGGSGADYMKAADSALTAADQASADGKTITVPIAEK